MAYGILFIRVVLGLTVAAHGAQKLFGAFGGGGAAGTAENFRSLGFRWPYPMALAAGAAEFGGGFLFALGLLTPLAALAMGVTMLTAIGTVHARNGFWGTRGGYEYPLIIWATAIGIAATRGERFSLDAAFGWEDQISGIWWGVGVLATSLFIAGVILRVGRRSAEAAVIRHAA
jgi:putative oxidoreductase